MEEYENERKELALIGDDYLIQVAQQAEKRIEAVKQIKKMALCLTNPRDWVDQNGNPYLMASGSEKVANLFNISWRIDEPTYEEDPDGHYTYSYKGHFSLGSRTTEAEGSRSSRDKFFIQYSYEEKERTEISISDRSNKRDVKMAAYTNLLGNGITRILGIRNLTWDDLKEFANITKEQVTTIQYRKGGEKPSVRMPTEKLPNGEPSNVPILSGVKIDSVTQAGGKKKDGSDYIRFTVNIGDQKYMTFSKTIAETAKRAASFEGVTANIEYKDTKFGPEIIVIALNEPPEPGSDG